MEERSELMKFLETQMEQGETHGPGSFTISRDKAVAKMAEFQLPFAEAWVVKVLQAVVAQGEAESITIHLTPTETRFQVPKCQWDLGKLQSAFFDPEACGDRQLMQLMIGLWSVAHHDGRAFQLTVTGRSERIVWDGQRLHEIPSEEPVDSFSLTVTHGATKSGVSGLLGNLAEYRARNANLLTALSNHCFPCPVPLKVDGRRLDALQHAVNAECFRNAVPVGLAFANGTPPQLPVPPGTYEDIISYLGASGEAGWSKVSEQLMDGVAKLDTASTAALILIDPGDGFMFSRIHSKVLWVQDGVLIDSEPLMSQRADAALGCFVSAQGLKTDLTTFKLVQNPKRRERIAATRRLARNVIMQTKSVDFSNIRRIQGTRGRMKEGLALVLLGIGTAWAAPLVGAGMVVAGVAGAALSRDPLDRAEQVRVALEQLEYKL